MYIDPVATIIVRSTSMDNVDSSIRGLFESYDILTPTHTSPTPTQCYGFQIAGPITNNTMKRPNSQHLIERIFYLLLIIVEEQCTHSCTACRHIRFPMEVNM